MPKITGNLKSLGQTHHTENYCTVLFCTVVYSWYSALILSVYWEVSYNLLFIVVQPTKHYWYATNPALQARYLLLRERYYMPHLLIHLVVYNIIMYPSSRWHLNMSLTSLDYLFFLLYTRFYHWYSSICRNKDRSPWRRNVLEPSLSLLERYRQILGPEVSNETVESMYCPLLPKISEAIAIATKDACL